MEMRQETKISLAWELLEAGVPKSHIAQHLELSRRTVIRWSQAFEQAGSLTAFLDGYQQAKRGPRRKRKRDAVLQRRIWTLRRKHRHCCGQKLQYFLEKEYGKRVSVTTIYKILQNTSSYARSGKRTRFAGRCLKHSVPGRSCRWIRLILARFLPSWR